MCSDCCLTSVVFSRSESGDACCIYGTRLRRDNLTSTRLFLVREVLMPTILRTTNLLLSCTTKPAGTRPLIPVQTTYGLMRAMAVASSSNMGVTAAFQMTRK